MQIDPHRPVIVQIPMCHAGIHAPPTMLLTQTTPTQSFQELLRGAKLGIDMNPAFDHQLIGHLLRVARLGRLHMPDPGIQTGSKGVLQVVGHEFL